MWVRQVPMGISDCAHTSVEKKILKRRKKRVEKLLLDDL
jgi:hypothetical protein